MTSKRFVILSLALTAFVATLFVGFNISMNEFGLYGNVKAGERRVWTYNRATKYLFSLNYIPKNFDGILIGSSSSAEMLDTRQIKSATTYNLSMNGANICEVAPAALNALEKGKMHFLVICLNPYLTQNSMMKTSELSPHLLTSTYGSLFIVRFYAYKLLYSLFPEIDQYRDSWWGYMFLNRGKSVLTQESIDQSVASAPSSTTPFIVDPNAIQCLNSILETARRKGTTIVPYYHPELKKLFDLDRAMYQDYQKQMQKLFIPGETIIDFNSSKYDYLTEDISLFHDTAHLTKKGGDAVLKVIDEEMQKSRRE